VDEVFWQHLDAETSLRTGLLRSLFCCLRNEGVDQTQRLAWVLDQARLGLLAQHEMSDACLDRRLSQKHVRSLLLTTGGSVNKARFECFLYLQVPPVIFDLVVDRVQPHNWVDGFKVSVTPSLQFGYGFIRDRV